AVFSGTVATFTPDTTVGPSGLLTATIDWGDGTTSAGLVSGDDASGYAVSGTHTYADSGVYTAAVLVVDERNGAGTLVNDTATISNVAPTATLAGLPSTISEGAVVSGVGSGADISPADQAALAFQWSVTK